jgi:hypothetical protein
MNSFHFELSIGAPTALYDEKFLKKYIHHQEKIIKIKRRLLVKLSCCKKKYNIYKYKYEW